MGWEVLRHGVSWAGPEGGNLQSPVPSDGRDGKVFMEKQA